MTGLSAGSSFISSQERKNTHTGISYSSLSLLDLFQRCHWRWQSRGIGYLSEGYLIIHLFIDWVKQVYVTLFTWKDKRSCSMWKRNFLWVQKSSVNIAKDRKLLGWKNKIKCCLSSQQIQRNPEHYVKSKICTEGGHFLIKSEVERNEPAPGTGWRGGSSGEIAPQFSSWLPADTNSCEEHEEGVGDSTVKTVKWNVSTCEGGSLPEENHWSLIKGQAF